LSLSCQTTRDNCFGILLHSGIRHYPVVRRTPAPCATLARCVNRPPTTTPYLAATLLTCASHGGVPSPLLRCGCTNLPLPHLPPRLSSFAFIPSRAAVAWRDARHRTRRPAAIDWTYNPFQRGMFPPPTVVGFSMPYLRYRTRMPRFAPLPLFPPRQRGTLQPERALFTAAAPKTLFVHKRTRGVRPTPHNMEV